MYSWIVKVRIDTIILKKIVKKTYYDLNSKVMISFLYTYTSEYKYCS